MTQASLKSVFSAATDAQVNGTSYAASGSLYVAVGDLIFAVGRFAVGGNRTWSDNLGNTWTNIDANGLRSYCRITTAGTLTTITMSWSSQSSGAALVNATIFEGPFETSPLDRNPGGSTDTTDPYTCPASGTLAKATELVLGVFIYTRPNGSTLTTSSPFAIASQTDTGTTASSYGAAVNYAQTNTTSALTPAFATNINISSGTLYTNSFKFTPRRRPMSLSN